MNNNYSEINDKLNSFISKKQIPNIIFHGNYYTDKYNIVMNFINKYSTLLQWALLFISFFGLIFAIDIPEGYKFIRAQAEFSVIEGQSEYSFLGTTVRYSFFEFLWRLPPW